MKEIIKEKLIQFKNIIKEHKKLNISILLIFLICCGYVIKNVQHEMEVKRINAEIASIQSDAKLKKAKEDLDDVSKQLDDFTNKNKLIITGIKEENYSNGYHDIKVTVKNISSDNVNYVKIGFNFKNENGDIIQSDWTNDNSVIKPKAQQILTKKVSDDIKYKTVEPEIQEVK